VRFYQVPSLVTDGATFVVSPANDVVVARLRNVYLSLIVVDEAHCVSA
jgi:superfamily II DNA helicase RecQ